MTLADIANVAASHIEWTAIFIGYLLISPILYLIFFQARSELIPQFLSFLIVTGGLIYHQVESRRAGLVREVERWEGRRRPRR